MDGSDFCAPFPTASGHPSVAGTRTPSESFVPSTRLGGPCMAAWPVGHPVGPSGNLVGRRADLPGFLGPLVHTCPALGPRGGGVDLTSSSSPPCGLPLVQRRRPSHVVLFGAQSRGPRARCLRFAAGVAPGLAQDSLPAGWSPWPDGTLTRWGPMPNFKVASSTPPFPTARTCPGALNAVILASPKPQNRQPHQSHPRPAARCRLHEHSPLLSLSVQGALQNLGHPADR
jgi:hypothetical protein